MLKTPPLRHPDLTVGVTERRSRFRSFQRSSAARPQSSPGLRRRSRSRSLCERLLLVQGSLGSAPVTHLDQEREAPDYSPGSLARGVPQKTVGSRPRPIVCKDRSRGSRFRVQPLVARDQGASAGSLEGGRRRPLRPPGFTPDPVLGSAASSHIYPNANSILNGTWSRIT
jgi:hypothetical protein